MKKFIAVSAIALSFAGSALAQQAVPGPDKDAGSQSIPARQPDQTVPTYGAAPSYGVDATTTQSIGASNMSGIQGRSSAGTNEYCPAGTAGAGVSGMPDTPAAKNMACNQ